MLEAADARHDKRGAVIGDQTAQAFRLLALNSAQSAQDWPSVRALATASRIQEPKLDAAYSSPINSYIPTQVWPLEAEALARGGDFKAAHALIDRTSGDFDLCLRERGTIDALEKNSGGADYWFATAVSKAPSIPFAYTDWGQSLLERGDTDAAIDKFKLANQKGPHFADPLEGWGEALMKQNRSDRALAKFAQAEKYAPNWGHLHLKWGEALVYAGKKEEAQKQFALAAGLTAAEKTELAAMNHG
jgi:tetratricopeptide (TPR) repeat protein